VQYSYGGFYFIYVLTSRSAGTGEGDLKLIGADLKFAYGVALGAAYGTVIDFLKKVKESE